MKKRVCVIIPAYNEGPVIADVIESALATFSKDKTYTIDVVVIDDGSKDKTAQAATAAGVKVIRHILNTGAGGATLTGLAHARQQEYDIAATMDADGQHDPGDVLVGIHRVHDNRNDLLIGSRLIDSTGMSKTKILGNKGLSLITRMLFNVNVTDSQSGLRVYSRRAIEHLDWKNNGYEFCSEMIWRAKQAKMSVAEYPIKAIYTDYSKSKGQNNWNAINIIKRLFKQRLVEFFE